MWNLNGFILSRTAMDVSGGFDVLAQDGYKKLLGYFQVG